MWNRTPIVPLMGKEVALGGWFSSWRAHPLALPRTPPQLEAERDMEPQASMELSGGHFWGRRRGYGRGAGHASSICCALS